MRDVGMEVAKQSGSIINGVFGAFKQDLETQEKATELHYNTVQTKLRVKTALELANMWHKSKTEADNLHANKELKLRELQYNCLLGLQGSWYTIFPFYASFSEYRLYFRL